MLIRLLDPRPAPIPSPQRLRHSMLVNVIPGISANMADAEPPPGGVAVAGRSEGQTASPEMGPLSLSIFPSYLAWVRAPILWELKTR